MAGVKVVGIAYKSSGAGIISLLGGEVQIIFAASPASVAPHMKAGTLRAIAVGSLQPSALFPGLPTVSASGLPGYESILIQGIFAPGRPPVAIITRLNKEIELVLNQPDVKERVLTIGAEVTPSSPEQLAATMKSDIVKLGKVIKDAGIKGD